MEAIISANISGRNPEKMFKSNEVEEGNVSFGSLLSLLTEVSEMDTDESPVEESVIASTQLIMATPLFNINEIDYEELSQEGLELMDVQVEGVNYSQNKQGFLINNTDNENGEDIKNSSESNIAVSDLNNKTQFLDNNPKNEIEDKIKRVQITADHNPIDQKSKYKNLVSTTVLPIDELEDEVKITPKLILEGYQNFLSDKNESLIENSGLVNQNKITGEHLSKDRILEQVFETAKIAFNEPKQEVELQMFPERLGKLSFRFTLENGVLTGKVSVMSNDLKDIIQNNLSELKDSLASQGIALGNLDVSVGHQNTKRNWSRENTFSKNKDDDNSDVIDGINLNEGFLANKKGYPNFYGGSIDFFA